MAVIPTATFNQKYSGFTASTVGSFISGPIPVQSITWCLTASVTSTWSLQLDESTAVHGTTESRRILGPIWASTKDSVVNIPIGHWCNSVYVTTLSGGVVNLFPAPRSGTGYIF